MTWEDPTWLQGTAGVPSYSAREDRIFTDSIWTEEGVLDMTAFKVTQRGAGANFSVDVTVGSGVIQGDDQTNQGKYLVKCTAAENVVIGAAPGSNSRFDLLVVEVNDPNATNARTPVNITEFKVYAGTPAASPTVPALPVTAIPIAVIGPIATATGSITNALIWDITNWASAPANAQAMAAVSRQAAGRSAPPGTIRWSASPYACNGELPCAGTSVLVATYPRLFAEIGYTFGGAGVSFLLPDMRGRSLVAPDNLGGSDAGRLDISNALGVTGGEQYHVLTTPELASHSHQVDPPNTAVGITDPGHNHAVGSMTSCTAFGTYPVAAQPTNSGVLTAGLTTTSSTTGITAAVDIGVFASATTGSGTGHNNMTPFLQLNAFIKV